MIRLFSLLAVLLIYTFTLTLIFNEKFGKCVPTSFILLSFELLICSIIGSIFYLKYLILITLLICCVFIIWKRKLINKNIFNQYFNISFIIFILLFIFIYIRTKNLYLSNIDDLHYYSRLVKDVLRNGVVYTNSLKTTVSPGAYPPFCVLLQSAFCALLGGYSEPNLLFSTVLFSLSFFVIIFDKLKYTFKDILKGFLIIAIIVVVTLSIQQNRTMSQPVFIYNSIYNDWLISIIAAHIYYLVFSDQTNLFFLTIEGTALCLIKPHSLPLYLLAVFAYVVKEYFDNKKKIKDIIKPILILILPIFIYLLIDKYKSIFIGISTLNSSISVLNINSTGVLNNQANELLTTYINALIFEPLMTKPFEMSYLLIIFIQTIVLILVNKKYKRTIAIFYLVGSAGYAVMLYYTFLSRGVGEGLGLVMYGRYMQTYTYLGMLLITYFFVEYRDKYYTLVIFLLVSLFFVDQDSVKYINPFEKVEMFKEKERNELQYYFDTQYNNEKLLVLNNTNINYFALIENIIDTRGDNVTYLKGNFKENNITLEKFVDICKKNELLLIGDYDDWFYNNIWLKISNAPCYNSALYKIKRNNDSEIDFELLYVWE